jgi:hypothetical protein
MQQVFNEKVNGELGYGSSFRHVCHLTLPTVTSQSTPISLHVHRGSALSTDQVKTKMPPFSIALNRVVDSGPFFDGRGPRQIFSNEVVDPISTRTSSFQVWVAIKMGLPDAFKKDDAPQMEIFLKQCDPYTALSVWLLRNSEKCIEEKTRDQVERLVYALDELRYEGEINSLNTSPKILEQINWIFEPADSPLSSNEHSSEKRDEEIISKINQIGERITRFVEGSGEIGEKEDRPNCLVSELLSKFLRFGQNDKIDPNRSVSISQYTSNSSDEFATQIASGIILHVKPRHVYQLEDFIEQTPAYSVGLDGTVYGPSCKDKIGLHLNVNHHEEVDRFATRSTAQQIFLLSKLGRFREFPGSSDLQMHIHVNDPDEDVCLAVWLLKNQDKIEDPWFKEKIEILVRTAELLDATAGAFPFDPDSEIMRQISWIFEPYNEARKASKISGMNGKDMASLIEMVGGRITKYAYGEGEKKQLQMNYEEVDQGQGWRLLEETPDTGSAGRIGFFNHGGRAFCSFREVNFDGEERYAYSLCRFSPYITGFPLDEFYYLLNRVEGLQNSSNDTLGESDRTGASPREFLNKLIPKQLINTITNYFNRLLNRVEGSQHSANDLWGGGDSSGGSPRKSLSKLAPQQFKSIIDSYLGFRGKPLASGQSGQKIVDLYLKQNQNFIEQVKSGKISDLSHPR